MNVTDRLETAIVSLEEELKRRYPPPEHKRFEFKDAASAAYRDGHLNEVQLADCRSLWEIRNLLSHRRFGGRRPVVATAEGAVLAEGILEALSGRVPRVDIFSARPGNVATVRPDSTVRDALKLMQSNDYTSLPVVDQTVKFQGLLSSHDLLVWIASELESIGLVEDAPVGRVARTGGVDYRFVPRDLPQRDARRAFHTHPDEHGQPLAALLITKTGAIHEDLLGILTPWDLPTLAS
ncbi:CBS domain-containing protein [Egicoccus sp. AB-alg6-2]|uniref:CBS domain-containing protein n=1 Tax=Egicoccus sp. AB-alg6-2 TaxID=3242692 RepID=UPI00359CF120